MEPRFRAGLTRREVFKLGLMSGAATLIGSRVFRPTPVFGQAPACSTQGVIEAFPTSPLILDAFSNEDWNLLPIPQPLKPEPLSEYSNWSTPPAPWQGGVNDSDGIVHQCGPRDLMYNGAPLPPAIIYKIELQVRPHRFTGGRLLTLVDYVDQDGNIVPGEINHPGEGKIYSSQPDCTIYGFNGTFPGPMINAEYGKPACVRFINGLDDDHGLDRQDFGAPDWRFLTHLHNGHTAPESDGNPNHKPSAYGPGGGWVDNLYLNWPAGGDDREKQSFFWFHDHRMDHTGANVYKGMVGL